VSNRTPIIRQTSWLMTIPLIAFLIVAIAIAISLTNSTSTGLVLGAGVTLAYTLGARTLIAGPYQRAMRLVRQRRYEEAIQGFETSLAFFERHPWIDRLRAFILMMPSPAGYREMALLNAAYCYSQLHQWRQTRALYERVIDEFGDTSGIAALTLKMLDRAERPGKS
jgi:tetratricopeptide (TPR) repeat protein